MSNLYVACELCADKGRILLGALQREGLFVSEAGEFRDLNVVQGGTVEWNLSSIYQQVLAGIRGILAQEEPVRGISFHSELADSLLFEGNGSLVTSIRPTLEAANNALQKVLSKLSAEVLYEQTGVQPSPQSLACQLVAESSRRLRRTGHALSLPDSFNYLLSGLPRAEISQAHLTQLYNPLTKSWSEDLLKACGVPARIMPQVVPAGTSFGAVRQDIAVQAGLEDARVIATCSYELAAALSALTIADLEHWAFLRPDDWTLVGTTLEEPFINDVSREMKYTNLIGYGNACGFYKSWAGLRLVNECHRAWSQQDRAMDSDVLMHLATSATPFEAFIDPGDPRFLTAEDMPQAIQAFCRETGQEAPRKPGPTLRCVLESLALHYRRALLELEYITGKNFTRVYVLGDKSHHLLNHFLANALQIPVVAVPSSLAALGNVTVQALSLGHIASPEQAHQLINHALKAHPINPHAAAWTEAYDRFLALKPQVD